MKMLYCANDAEKRLAELSVGTEDARAIMDLIRRLDSHTAAYARKLRLAESIIGEYVLQERMIEESYDE